jgi:hypothetical protein
VDLTGVPEDVRPKVIADIKALVTQARVPRAPTGRPVSEPSGAAG